MQNKNKIIYIRC